MAGPGLCLVVIQRKLVLYVILVTRPNYHTSLVGKAVPVTSLKNPAPTTSLLGVCDHVSY